MLKQYWHYLSSFHEEKSQCHNEDEVSFTEAYCFYIML